VEKKVEVLASTGSARHGPVRRARRRKAQGAGRRQAALRARGARQARRPLWRQRGTARGPLPRAAPSAEPGARLLETTCAALPALPGPPSPASRPCHPGASRPLACCLARFSALPANPACTLTADARAVYGKSVLTRRSQSAQAAPQVSAHAGAAVAQTQSKSSALALLHSPSLHGPREQHLVLSALSGIMLAIASALSPAALAGCMRTVQRWTKPGHTTDALLGAARRARMQASPACCPGPVCTSSPLGGAASLQTVLCVDVSSLDACSTESGQKGAALHISCWAAVATGGAGLTARRAPRTAPPPPRAAPFSRGRRSQASPLLMRRSSVFLSALLHCSCLPLAGVRRFARTRRLLLSRGTAQRTAASLHGAPSGPALRRRAPPAPSPRRTPARPRCAPLPSGPQLRRARPARIAEAWPASRLRPTSRSVPSSWPSWRPLPTLRRRRWHPATATPLPLRRPCLARRSHSSRRPMVMRQRMQSHRARP
jgi:hypothetical protein